MLFQIFYRFPPGIVKRFRNFENTAENFSTEEGKHVLLVTYFNAGTSYFMGEDTFFDVEVNDYYDCVTIVSMAINTKNYFVSINSVKVHPGDVFDLYGLDVGSEGNNDKCRSIPGTACTDLST